MSSSNYQVVFRFPCTTVSFPIFNKALQCLRSVARNMNEAAFRVAPQSIVGLALLKMNDGLPVFRLILPRYGRKRFVAFADAVHDCLKSAARSNCLQLVR